MAETLELVILVDTKKGIVSVRKAGGEIKQLGKTAEKTGKEGKKNFGSLWKSMAVGALVAKGLTASLRTLKRAVSDVVNEAMDFEDQWANVTTLVSDSSINMSVFRNEILDMAGELGSATELTKGMYQALSAGVKPGEAVKFVGDAARFAKAGLTDMDSAVKVIATAMNVYGFRVDQASEISDIFFETNKRGMTTVNELAGSFGRVMGVAKSVGIEFRELNAIVASLTAGGIKTTETMSSLKAIVANIATPTEQARVAAKRLKIQFDIAAVSAKGFTGFMKDMTDKVKGDVQAQKDLFGSIEAFNAIAVLTSKEGMKRYTEALDAMGKKTDNTNIAFRKQQSTLRATVTAIKNEFLAVLTKKLLPGMKALSKWLNENKEDVSAFIKSAVAGLAEFSKGIMKFIGWIAKATNKFVKFTKDFGQFANELRKEKADLASYRDSYSDIVTAIQQVKQAMGKTKELRAFNVEMRRITSSSDDYATKNINLLQLLTKHTKANNALRKAYKKIRDAQRGVIEASSEEAAKVEELSDAEEERKKILAANIELEKARLKIWKEWEPQIRKIDDSLFKLLGIEREGFGIKHAMNEANKKTLEQFPLLGTAWLDNMKKVKDNSKATKKWVIDWEDANEVLQFSKSVLSGITDILGSLGVELNKTTDDLIGLAEGAASIAVGISKKNPAMIIQGVVSAIGSAISLLSGDGIGQAITRENSWMKMNEALTESLKELAKEVGDTHAATSLMLSDIMDQSDITVDNFADWANRVKEIFIDLESGYISQSEFLTTMGASWTKLVGEAQRLGTEGSAEMLGIIRKMRDSGQEIAEITEYINSTLNSGLNAFSQYIKVPGDIAREIVDLEKSISDLRIGSSEYTEALEQLDALDMKFSQMTSQENFDRATQYAMAFFNSLQAEGNTMMEIINIMGSQLDTLFDIGQVGGFESGMLSELFGLRQFVTDNQDVINSIGASQEMLRAFGNTAFLTQEIFQASQQDALGFYDQLRAAGGSQVDSLRAVAPLLAEQLWFSEQYNLTLDARTKELIDNARAEGIRLDAMRPIEEVQREMGDNIRELVDIFKDWLGVTDDQTKALGKMGSIVRSIADESRRIQMPGFSKTGPAVDRIPAFASGTNRQFVKEDGMFELHAGEIADVTNDDRMRITPAVAAPPGGGGSGGGGTSLSISAPISLVNENTFINSGSSEDPDKFAADVNQVIEDNLDDIEVKFETMIRKVVREEVPSVQ